MTEWAEFAERCAGNVRKIRETGDDGLFAKLYAADVDRLLRVSDHIDENRCSPAEAFEATR